MEGKKEFEEEARYYIIVLREGPQMNQHVENVSLMESREAGKISILIDRQSIPRVRRQ